MCHWNFVLTKNLLIDPTQIYLQFTVKVTKADGTKLVMTDEVSTVNNFAYSIFSGVDVYLQEQKIFQGQGYYPYMTYVNMLLNTTDHEKDYYLREALWRRDDPGMMDSIGSDEAGARNKRFTDRSAYIQQSITCNMLAKVV